MLNFCRQSILPITVLILIMFNSGICAEKSKKTRKKVISRENKALLDIFLRLEVGSAKGKDGKPNRQEKAYLTYAYVAAITWLGEDEETKCFL